MTDPDKSTRDVTFDEFVRAYCREDKPAFADVGAQSRFLNPRKGMGVDHLFRYEQIEDFVRFLEDRLDFEIILPRLNVSPEASMVLSGETEDLLRRFATRDFEIYETLRFD